MSLASYVLLAGISLPFFREDLIHIFGKSQRNGLGVEARKCWNIRFNNEMLRVHVIIMSEKRRRVCERQLFAARAGANIVAIKAALYDRATYITHEECKRIQGVPFFILSCRPGRPTLLDAEYIRRDFNFVSHSRPAAEIPSSERRGRSISPIRLLSLSSLLLLTKVYRHEHDDVFGNS